MLGPFFWNVYSWHPLLSYWHVPLKVDLELWILKNATKDSDESWLRWLNKNNIFWASTRYQLFAFTLKNTKGCDILPPLKESYWPVDHCLLCSQPPDVRVALTITQPCWSDHESILDSWPTLLSTLPLSHSNNVKQDTEIAGSNWQMLVLIK